MALISSLTIFIAVLCIDLTDFVPSNESITLTNLTRRACVEVAIIDDQEFENLRETLNITVSTFSLDNTALVGFASINTTQLTIVDDDRVAVLGFEDNSTQISVSESVGGVTLCVGILAPGLDVQFSEVIGVVVGTRSGTAGVCVN